MINVLVTVCWAFTMCQSRQDCTQAESGTVGFEPSSVWFQTFALTRMLIICKLSSPDDLERGPLTEADSSATLWTAAQTVKNLPAMRETWVRSLGREDPLEKEMATHSSILAWGIPWMENSGGLQSTGSQRVGHDWATEGRIHKLTLDVLYTHVFISKNYMQCKRL